MTRRIVVAPEAVRDLAAIAGYVQRRDSAAAAVRLIRLIRKRMKELALSAESFPIREEIGQGIRGVEYKRYLILFRVYETEVRFTNVVHAARDVHRLFARSNGQTG